LCCAPCDGFETNFFAPPLKCFSSPILFEIQPCAHRGGLSAPVSICSHDICLVFSLTLKPCLKYGLRGGGWGIALPIGNLPPSVFPFASSRTRRLPQEFTPRFFLSSYFFSLSPFLILLTPCPSEQHEKSGLNFEPPPLLDMYSFTVRISPRFFVVPHFFGFF